mmetsp:Transcript_81210/g.188641  ORF Transcript_81210/g.188641 Transcript_81210/m.188641 type:complete len:526 (-) Transcript_81210:270-1847(-)
MCCGAADFERTAANFLRLLPHARFVAVDLELTGIGFEREPDGRGDSPAEREDKLCRIAETYAPIQLGLTLVCREQHCQELKCETFSFFMLPSTGSFACSAAAMRFNADHGLDFNAWIRDGVSYISREEEAEGAENSQTEELPAPPSLLGLWKALCAARLPLVVHGPLDVFFLLRCFERRQLPRGRQLSELIGQCFSRVYDTALLLEGFRPLGFSRRQLLNFFADVQARLASMGRRDPTGLYPGTAQRYGGVAEGAHAHEAGFDSLITARLFACLYDLCQEAVEERANRLFLYNHGASLDLRLDPAMPEPLLFAGGSYKALRRHVGVVISAARNADGFGFITCDEATARFGCNVFVNRVQLGDCDVGQRVSFELTLNERGQPQARSVAPLPEVADSHASSDAEETSPGAASRHSSASTASEGAPRYFGSVKSFNDTDGYGFIRCEETHRRYGRDVFLHRAQLAGCNVGWRVSFEVTLNGRGQPQARRVVPVPLPPEPASMIGGLELFPGGVNGAAVPLPRFGISGS